MNEKTPLRTLELHVSGMHCKACIYMTESELTDLPHVTHAKSSLKTHTVELTGEFGDKTEQEIADELSLVLLPRGYSLHLERQPRKQKWSEFTIAVPIALAFAALFVLLQKAGLVNLVGGGQVTYGTAFVIGIIASLSTCMAVVGGLVLSMSATFAREGDTVRPQVLFHVGRLISFFLLGGVIGALGAAFQLSAVASFVFSFIR